MMRKFLGYVTKLFPERKGGLDKLPENCKYCAEGLPVAAPDWPQHRGIKDVQKILGTKEKPVDFVKLIPDNGCVIEIGCGDGNFLADLKKARSDLTTVGVNVTTWAGENVPKFDEFYLQYVPDDKTLLETRRATADVVVDIFASTTFSYNPVHSLIYSAMLLKEGGEFYSMSALATEGYSCFGTPKTRDLIVNFFKERMNIDVEFEKRTLKNGFFTTHQHLLTHFKVANLDALNDLDFEDLKNEIDQTIGKPKNVTEMKSWWVFSFGQFSITAKDYVLEEN